MQWKHTTENFLQPTLLFVKEEAGLIIQLKLFGTDCIFYATDQKGFCGIRRRKFRVNPTRTTKSFKCLTLVSTQDIPASTEKSLQCKLRKRKCLRLHGYQSMVTSVDFCRG